MFGVLRASLRNCRLAARFAIVVKRHSRPDFADFQPVTLNSGMRTLAKTVTIGSLCLHQIVKE